jgi:hypothetical protein
MRSCHYLAQEDIDNKLLSCDVPLVLLIHWRHYICMNNDGMPVALAFIMNGHTA